MGVSSNSQLKSLSASINKTWVFILQKQGWQQSRFFWLRKGHTFRRKKKKRLPFYILSLSGVKKILESWDLPAHLSIHQLALESFSLFFQTFFLNYIKNGFVTGSWWWISPVNQRQLKTLAFLALAFDRISSDRWSVIATCLILTCYHSGMYTAVVLRYCFSGKTAAVPVWIWKRSAVSTRELQLFVRQGSKQDGCCFHHIYTRSFSKILSSDKE